MLDFLREEHVDEHIIKGIEDFWREHPSPERALSARPRYVYYGKKVWEQAAEALLCGENLLLAGSKATGKNVLAENLAALFGRPSYNVSFHINMDASYMIGTDTFRDGQVVFRPGPICQCAVQGGFCILDEINMARNEALAVLHSVLDFRRVINVPGYDTIRVHDAARSRFMAIHMPEITQENLEKLLRREFPDMNRQFTGQFSGLFADIDRKCRNGELTSKVLDLRGLLDAIRLIRAGLPPRSALDMGITNKTFDDYEQSLVRDIISSRISPKADRNTIFN